MEIARGPTRSNGQGGCPTSSPSRMGPTLRQRRGPRAKGAILYRRRDQLGEGKFMRFDQGPYGASTAAWLGPARAAARPCYAEHVASKGAKVASTTTARRWRRAVGCGPAHEVSRRQGGRAARPCLHRQRDTPEGRQGQSGPRARQLRPDRCGDPQRGNRFRDAAEISDEQFRGSVTSTVGGFPSSSPPCADAEAG